MYGEMFFLVWDLHLLDTREISKTPCQHRQIYQSPVPGSVLAVAFSKPLLGLNFVLEESTKMEINTTIYWTARPPNLKIEALKCYPLWRRYQNLHISFPPGWCQIILVLIGGRSVREWWEIVQATARQNADIQIVKTHINKTISCGDASDDD